MELFRTLVVDDSATMRAQSAALCRELGFTDLAEADDGEPALDQIRRDPSIRLVLSDWNMPRMTGLELLRAVRADARTRELPFIIISTVATADRVREAVAAGVNGYLRKPATLDRLRDVLLKAGVKLPG